MSKAPVLSVFSNNVLMGAKAKGRNQCKEKPHGDKEEESPKEPGKQEQRVPLGPHHHSG